MKMLKPLLLYVLMLSQLHSNAQVQWYQNQDANNQVPYGTVATTIQSFTSSTFIACYLWSTEGESNTWKISKSNINGTELKTYFITGISATVEFKVSNDAVYVLEKSFTAEYLPQYKLRKLDGHLIVRAQRNIALPNNFYIYNTNVFELDGSANVYFTGDGQYEDGAGGYAQASFVWKMDKNLNTKWKRVDSTQTSYTRLHIDGQGKVVVLADYYTFFPQVQIKKFGSHNGQLIVTHTVNTDPGRFSLHSTLDENDNLILYGSKSIGDTAQGAYFIKVSKTAGHVMYRRTHFTAPGAQLNDMKVDRQGRMFTLVSQNIGTEQISKISRFNPANGTLYWTRTFNYSSDSCNLMKLVLNGGDRIFAIGEKRSCNYFSKGFALRLKKNNGQQDGNYPAPDSVAFQRSHWLSEGMMDHDDHLIAIGNTTDLDTMTYSNTYFRAFAVRFNHQQGCGRGDNSGEEEGVLDSATEAKEPLAEKEDLVVQTKLMIYPNPVQDLLMVSGINTDEYDRVLIFNMQGAQLQQQYVRGTSTRMNISSFADGVYLLVLRSSISGKEKSVKFVVKK